MAKTDRGAAGGCAVQWCSTPGWTRWPRPTGNDRGNGGRCEMCSGECARAGAGSGRLRQGPAVWFITRGAQVLERETGGEPAGAALWGFGKAVDREAAHLQPRMIDLDPGSMAPAPDLVNELLYPDVENHIAYRRGQRRAARLVRAEDTGERLVFPEGLEWVLAPDPAGVFDRPCVQPLPVRALEPRGSTRRGGRCRAQLLGRVPFSRLHRGGSAGQGDVRLHS